MRNSSAHYPKQILNRQKCISTILVLVIAFAALLSVNDLFGPVSAWGQQKQQETGQPPIRVRVSLVSTPIAVRDKTGKIVTNLGPKDFRLYDNGIPQAPEAVEVGEGAPYAIVFVVETSSRVESLLPLLRRTGALLTEHILGENGEAALITYSNRIETKLALTNDRAAIQKSVANLQPGGSDAFLYDALSEAITLVSSSPENRRRVIVTFAEAVDTGSEAKLSDLVKDAQMGDVTIYSIGLSTVEAAVRGPEKQTPTLRPTPRGTTALAPIPGPVPTPTLETFFPYGNIDVGGFLQPAWSAVMRKPVFETAVNETGGFYQSTIGYDSIEWCIDQISQELHLAYTLSFLPNQPKSGFHKIAISMVRKPYEYKLRYRPVYYTAPNQN